MGACQSASGGANAPINGASLEAKLQSTSSPQDWKIVAQKAKDDKKGWGIWNGKVLLGMASLKYKEAVTIQVGSPIPFDETTGWFEKGGNDHWFEIPLNTPEVREELGMWVPGKLYTTRMPRALDEQPGTDWSTSVVPEGQTDKRWFMEKAKDKNVTEVWVLVSETEMKEKKSTCLLDFYRSLGFTVHHTPVPDFTVPSFTIERENIEGLTTALAANKNCLIHCMGGSGRTATVAIGALQVSWL
jgi:hypothetical protein